MIEQIINKVLRANSTYGVYKLYENGIEFFAIDWFGARIVAYDNESKKVWVQLTYRGCNSEKSFQNENTDEISKYIIDLLKCSSRIGLIDYQPEGEKKELFCDKIKYEGKADRTLEEKLGSEEYKKFIEHCEELYNKPLLPSDIFNFPNTKPTYEDLEKSLKKHKDILWKQFGISLMYDDKYYQRNEYKPKQEVQDKLFNCFHQSNTDNSKVEMYDAEPYVFSVIWNFDGNGQITSSYSNNINTTIKQITPDIQHIITPSKNYFLFKLS